MPYLFAVSTSHWALEIRLVALNLYIEGVLTLHLLGVGRHAEKSDFERKLLVVMCRFGHSEMSRS